MSKPRLLVIGKRGGILNWPEQVVSASERLGFPTAFFALNHASASDRLVRKVVGLAGKRWGQRYIARALDELIERFQPDLLVLPDLIALSPEVKDVLGEYHGKFKVVYWIGDRFPETLLDYAPLVDRFYFTDTFLLREAQRFGLEQVGHLPLAVDTQLFSAQAKPFAERHAKALFVGAPSDNRRQLLEQVARSLHVVGKGWTQLPSRHSVTPRNVPLSWVAQLYSDHRLVLNVINSNNIRDGLNMRCFEATAAGAVLLTDRVADLPLCFVPEQEVLTYASIDELNQQLGRLVSDPSGVETIAAAGQRRTLAEHDYQQRIVRIVEDLLGDSNVSPVP